MTGTFAWDAAIVATLASVALMFVIAVLTCGPSLCAWAHDLLGEDRRDQEIRGRANVYPVDPEIQAALMAEWRGLDAPARAPAPDTIVGKGRA